MYLSCTHLARLAAVLVLLVAATANAAPLTEKPRGESPAEKLRKALDQTVDLDFASQPLGTAIDQLREQTKINFTFDQTMIALMGIDPSTTPGITVKLSKVKVRAALRTILNQANLAYAQIGDTILISTEEMAVYRQLKQRVSVDLDAVKFDAALKQLSRETGTTLLIDPRSGKDAQTSITLQLDDVPLETAVRLMAEMAGLKPVRMGNVLLVTTKAAAAELRAEPELVPAPKGLNGYEDLIVPGGGIKGATGIGIAPGAPMAVPVPGGAPADPPADKPVEKPPEKPEPKPAPPPDKPKPEPKPDR